MQRHASWALLMPLSIVIMTALLIPPLHAAETPLKALLITGQNNHNWQLSHPILKTIVEDTGLFQVDIALTPPEGGDMSTFTPVFSNYSVVIMDYTGDHWPDATRTAFLDFVRNGGGVVIYHAADNAFPDWPEYNELIGLGGWGNRSEKHGPYVFWRDGALVRDMRPGPGGAHGKQHQYVITHRVTDHPVTRGLPERWLHEKDELYHHLRGPAHNMTLLATAWSAPETGGSGEHEPVLFTIAYGKGRVFHTVLGHAGDDPPPAMQCVGFIVTVQRGTEWAATGQVTQPIPDDFPSEEQVRLRPQFKRTNPDKLLEELAAYTFGDSLEPLVTLEALARTRLSAKASLKDLQAGYVRLLESDAATVAAKNFACKQLSLFGNADAVPVLAALLGTAETASMARYALERIPGDESLNALRAALPVSTPEQLPGLIASLGAKQNLDTLPVIIPFLKSNDAQVAVAAIEALACMATNEAAETLLLTSDSLEETLKHRARDAYIRCGFSMLQHNQKQLAKTVFNTAYERFAGHALLQGAALRGRIAAAENEAGTIIMDTLRAEDPGMSTVAATALRDSDDPSLFSQAATLLPELPATVQVPLITALSEAGATNSTSALAQATHSEHASVRIAAIHALGVIGDATAVHALLHHASEASRTEQDTARASLARLSGADPILLEMLRTDDVKYRSEVVKAIVARRIGDATPILLEQLAHAEGADKLDILQALTQVADAGHLDMILPMLMTAGESDSAPLLDIVARAVKTSETGEKHGQALLDALKTEQTPSARANLYAALGKVADPETLPLFRRGLSESHAAVRLAVIEALAAWPDAAPLDLLRQAVEQFKGQMEGNAAIRGYLRLAALNESQDDTETAALILEMVPFVERTEEKQACITALGKTGAAQALPLLYETINDPDTDLVMAALRALGAWPDATPMNKLAALAQEGPEKVRGEALRGYFRLIGINQEISGEEAMARYKEALALAPTPAEQKRILSGLANTENPGALMAAAECLNDPELKDEAAVAVVKIAGNIVDSHPDAVRPILPRIASETGNAFVKDEIGKLYKQIEQFEDYITAWEVCGPYSIASNDMKKLFDTPFAPETADVQESLVWQSVPMGTHGAFPFLVELDQMLGGNNRAAYLRTHLRADNDMDAILELGSDDGIKVWLNEHLVHENDVVRPTQPGQDKAPVHLTAGLNTLLIKLTQAGGEWNLCARLRTADGEKIQGVDATVDQD